MYIYKGFWDKMGIEPPVAEYRFSSQRRWRIDYAWPDVKLAAEIEGGIFMRSKARHTNPIGFLKDMEKYNMLTEEGWHLLRDIPQKINYDQIIKVYQSLKGEMQCINKS